ncbi:hypothetical protein GMORB2_3800 [Geosmithia morbida]|uniref:Uncharacterized protein n=1 Tax=Geosmithia morbida TaxID=1094350 RepID=A0A9P4Z037_9HYPO|nr:uncharacterized protein GMORB2_3800 [Geosmithia morbida]KAF4124961.1 hypothetical protein GMORB2_3800 [Geosmithia morbida]
MSFEITRLLGTKTSISVPKDQEKVLDRHGMGAVRSDDYPISVDDVSSRVLSSLTEARVNNQKRDWTAAGLKESGGPKEKKKSRPNDDAVTDADTDEAVNDSRPSGQETTQEPAAAAGREPAAARDASQTTAVEDGTGATQKSSHPANRGSSSPVRSQPDNAEEQQTARTAAKPRSKTKPQSLAPVIHLPSSMEEPEDLEVQVPVARGQQQEAVPTSKADDDSKSPDKTPRVRQRTAMETPPCAQPSQTSVIPGTVARDAGSDDRNNGGSKDLDMYRRRSKRMKPIEFSDDPMDTGADVRSANPSTSFQRMAPTIGVEHGGGLSVQRNGGVMVNERRQVAATPSPSRANGPVAGGRDELMHEPGEDEAQAAETRSHTRQYSTPAQGSGQYASTPAHHQQQQQQQQQYTPGDPRGDDGALEPFEMFLTTYPSYITQHSGSLALFVKACMCLDHMAKHRSLHRCLWDDFIRAFSAQYLDYVRDATDPLVASDWYNDRDELPLFSAQVVRKENLGAILELYSDEVAKAKRYVVGGGGDGGRGRRRRWTVDRSSGAADTTINTDTPRARAVTQPQAVAPVTFGSGRPSPTLSFRASPTWRRDGGSRSSDLVRTGGEAHKDDDGGGGSSPAVPVAETPTAAANPSGSGFRGSTSTFGRSTPAAAPAPPPSSAGSSTPRLAREYFRSLGRRRSVKDQEKVDDLIRNAFKGRRSNGF